MHEQDRNLSMSETRNSKLRQLTSTPIQATTKRLHSALPWLEPTHITVLGAIGVAVASALAARAENTQQRAESALALAVASGTDAFDGALARRIESEKPGSIDFKKGAIYDAVSDRTQELFMAFSRAASASKRGDKLGKMAALLNGISNPLPSVTKAFAETQGVAAPESGKGAMGFFGTRVGRAVLEIAETSFPEIKGKPFQLVADSVVSYANISTAIDRLKRTYTELPTLSSDLKKDAEKRFKALALFTGIAIGATLIAHAKMKEKGAAVKIEEPVDKENKRYLEAVASVEAYGKEYNLNHRFVGGTIAGLFSPGTNFEVDIENKRVKVLNPEPQKMRRSSNNTVTDIDLVVFTPDLETFLDAREDFALNRKGTEAFGYSYPNISVEGARYPGWRKRSVVKQWVNAFEVSENNTLSLAFDDVKKEIPWESVAPWTYEFDGMEITGFNPIAEALCYAVRAPSGVKKKDQEVKDIRPRELKNRPNGEKIGSVGFNKLAIVGRVAHQVIEASKDPVTKESPIKDLYRPWIEYIHEMRDSSSLSIVTKRFLMGIYWGHDILGTDISQGTGPLGGLANLSNKFSG